MKEGKVILYVVDISLYGSFLENWDVFTLDRKSASSIISEDNLIKGVSIQPVM